MTSAAPARKPYRKAPPQHRETRHALPVALPTPPHDPSQVNQHSLNTPPAALPRRSIAVRQPYGLQRGRPSPSPPPRSDSEPDVSSVSSLEVCAPPPGRFSSQSQRTRPARTVRSQSPTAVRKPSPAHRGTQWSHTPAASATAPRSILKQPGSLGLRHTYDIIRKSQSVELLGDGGRKDACVTQPPVRSLRRCRASRRSSDPSSPCGGRSGQKTHVLKEKVRFSNFLDEITCRVMSPAHLRELGKLPSVKAQGRAAVRHCRSERRPEETSAQRSRRWDDWVSSVTQPNVPHLHEERQTGDGTERAQWKREKGPKKDVQKRHKHSLPVSNQSTLSQVKVGLLRSGWRLLFGHVSTCWCCRTSWAPQNLGGLYPYRSFV